MSPFVAILGTHPINKQGITAGMNISWGMVARAAKFLQWCVIFTGPSVWNLLHVTLLALRILK
jgi:hypothetical protein